MLLKRFFISMLGSLAAIWISAMLIIVLCMMFAISSIVSFSKTETTKIHHHSILCLDLNGPIDETVEMPTFMQIVNGEMNSTSTLSSIVDAIAAAKTDSKIEGLYIKANGAVAGMATRQAIRQAVESFRESGKWVVAYGDSYSQGDYYIATAADEVFLNPVGEIGLEGLATGIPFFKGLLDKLGVEMQVVKVGTFKSAVEPFLLDHMSEANRLQTSVYLDGLWSQYTEAVAKSRGISIEQHCKNSRTTAEALRAGYRADAERKIRTMYAARAIAEAENITVRPEEVNAEYRRLSVQQDTPEADIRRVLAPETVAAALAAQKVQRFLLDNAVVTSVMDPDKE